MEKTMRILLTLFIISGLLFTACETKEEGSDKISEFKVAIDEADVAVTEVPADGNDNVEKMATVDNSQTMNEVKMNQGSMMMLTYADGTYSSTGSYATPAGTQTIGVTLVVSNDIIKSVSIDVLAKTTTVFAYQTAFSKGIASLVNGVSLADLGTFSSVNGSSLTPKGFASAVASIQAQAQI